MEPGGEPGISDAVVSISDIQAGLAEQLVLAFALDGHLAPEDGLDLVGGVDVAVMGILIPFVLIIFFLALLLNVVRLAVVVLGFLARVDVLEDATILHGVVGLGVDLAWTL